MKLVCLGTALCEPLPVCEGRARRAVCRGVEVDTTILPRVRHVTVVTDKVYSPSVTVGCGGRKKTPYLIVRSD